MEDFARAREALLKADVKDCKLYLHPSGALIAVNGKDKAKVINEWALQAPTEVRGEFLQGGSWGSSFNE